MAGVATGSQVYFTHSFVAPVTGDTVAVTEHGEPFAAIVQRGHIAGVQFHPEKSGDVGLQILRNFVDGMTIVPGLDASKRIIACLDVRNGQVVKGINFEGLRSAGDPAELARRYNREGIDELVILDITATIEQRRALADTIRAVARELFIPLAVGGGIRTEADAAAAVEAGADKVSLNTAALSNPALITTLAQRYGSQAVLVAIDAKRADDRIRGLRAQRPERGRTRRGRVGARSRGARRGRDSADLDRSRRHEDRLRLPDDRRRVAGRLDSGHRVRRRRRARRFRRRLHGGLRRRRAGRVDLSLRGNERPVAQTTPQQRGYRYACESRRHEDTKTSVAS